MRSTALGDRHSERSPQLAEFRADREAQQIRAPFVSACQATTWKSLIDCQSEFEATASHERYSTRDELRGTDERIGACSQLSNGIGAGGGLERGQRRTADFALQPAGQPFGVIVDGPHADRTAHGQRGRKKLSQLGSIREVAKRGLFRTRERKLSRPHAYQLGQAKAATKRSGTSEQWMLRAGHEHERIYRVGNEVKLCRWHAQKA